MFLWLPVNWGCFPCKNRLFDLFNAIFSLQSDLIVLLLVYAVILTISIHKKPSELLQNLVTSKCIDGGNISTVLLFLERQSFGIWTHLGYDTISFLQSFLTWNPTNNSFGLGSHHYSKRFVSGGKADGWVPEVISSVENLTSKLESRKWMKISDFKSVRLFLLYH